MRYYLDTEFDEGPAHLLSVGIVAQDGREFYAVKRIDNERGDDITEWWHKNHPHQNEWLNENVVPHLFADIAKQTFIGHGFQIAREISAFVDSDNDARFWGYVPAWDIVLVHRLFGGYQRILEAGSNVPRSCYDLKQLAKSCGVEESLHDLVPQHHAKHHALADARWNKLVHEMIIVQYGREI